MFNILLWVGIELGIIILVCELFFFVFVVSNVGLMVVFDEFIVFLFNIFFVNCDLCKVRVCDNFFKSLSLDIFLLVYGELVNRKFFWFNIIVDGIFFFLFFCLDDVGIIVVFDEFIVFFFKGMFMNCDL